MDDEATEFDWEASNWTHLLNTSTVSVGSNADIDGMYCGLLENLIACLDNDSAACDDLAQWLDTWNGFGNDNGRRRRGRQRRRRGRWTTRTRRDASLLVVQAFDADSNAIANALFVYVLGYDEDNDFYWDFGDEGLPAQIRFPLGTTKPTGPMCFVSR